MEASSLVGHPNLMWLAQRKRVEITYHSPQLDQGNEEVIRVAKVLTIDLKW